MLINCSCFVSNPTGIAAYTQNLIPSLSQLHPILLSNQPFGDLDYYKIPANLSPDKGRIGHFRRLVWTQWQLPQIYHEKQANLLFSPFPEAPLNSHCRYIVTVHDLIPLHYPKRFSPLTTYFRYYVPQVLKQAQHLICNSQATADDIINTFGIPASRITPILLAYDQQHFIPQPNQQPSNYFLYLGRHDPHKNVEGLIQAFSQLSDSSYELWLVGPCDRRYTPKLQQQVTELGLSDRVKFLDYVPYSQLPNLIGGAIALVFPSLWEGFGLPVLEAMGCGTPVITSNCSSLPEVAGDAAILIDPTNVDEIADAMAQVAKNSQLRSQLREQGLKRASQFSWEKTGQTTAEVLQQYL